MKMFRNKKYFKGDKDSKCFRILKYFIITKWAFFKKIFFLSQIKGQNVNKKQQRPML